MIPACDMYSILKSLQEAFSERYEDRVNNHIRLTGILIAPPGSTIARTEIIPRLTDFHYRTANNIDFFVAGYGFGKVDSIYKEILDPPNTGWTYSSYHCNELIKTLEFCTSWEYSGGCELLLFNAKYKSSTGRVSLDYSTAVLLQLDKMKDQKSFVNVETFFEEIFSYAKTCTGQDPCWGFSDKIGVKKGLPAIFHLLSKAIPGKPLEEILKLKNYAVHDISKI
ncbi:hypothetical protein C9993_00715 [Marinobacter sp. Z-F4-2]|nr:hypothetical protein C9993_00715 [Marinobacter sp. Z-F4-2]|tara:strand:+ start:2330 stop:3001 length:672 start_codon:yes stop_codon:yes gene_type:complete